MLQNILKMTYQDRWFSFFLNRRFKTKFSPKRSFVQLAILKFFFNFYLFYFWIKLFIFQRHISSFKGCYWKAQEILRAIKILRSRSKQIFKTLLLSNKILVNKNEFMIWRQGAELNPPCRRDQTVNIKGICSKLSSKFPL